MMGLLRNREVRAMALVMGLVAVAGTVLCFLLEPVAGLVCALCCAGLAAVSLRYTGRRYRRLAALADRLVQIDRGDYTVSLAEFSDGELSILQSELQKVTRTLSHQAEKLGRDKRYLADALSDISHQLKTPLTSLSMLTELLESPGLPEDKRREFLAGLHSGLERIRWLIHALLKLSRLDAGAVVMRIERVALHEVVEQALEPLRIPMELGGQVLEAELPEDITLEGDKNWLAEALGNILKNCVEQTPPGGKVAVACSGNPLYTKIVISDSGPGISPEDLPHIFERFYKGKSASPDSVGIGLALSKTILQQHGGDVEAASSPDGATFTVKLYHRG